MEIHAHQPIPSSHSPTRCQQRHHIHATTRISAPSPLPGIGTGAWSQWHPQSLSLLLLLLPAPGLIQLCAQIFCQHGDTQSDKSSSPPKTLPPCSQTLLCPITGMMISDFCYQFKSIYTFPTLIHTFSSTTGALANTRQDAQINKVLLKPDRIQ